MNHVAANLLGASHFRAIETYGSKCFNAVGIVKTLLGKRRTEECMSLAAGAGISA
jgi:hypothetical protein